MTSALTDMIESEKGENGVEEMTEERTTEEFPKI